MSLEELKKMDASQVPIGKLITFISKGHNFYLNHKLEELNISASQVQALFEIKCSKGINQDGIASRCNIDKGAIARSLKKLEDKGLVLKEIDENNRRQNKISLTSEGEEVIEKSISILEHWEEEVFKEVDKEKKLFLQEFLKETAIKTYLINMDLKNCKKE